MHIIIVFSLIILQWLATNSFVYAQKQNKQHETMVDNNTPPTLTRPSQDKDDPFSLENLTKGCEIFSSQHKPMIEVRNGTFIPNYAATHIKDEEFKRKKFYKEKNDELEKSTKKKLNLLRWKLSKLLNTYDAKEKLHPEVKQFLSDQIFDRDRIIFTDSKSNQTRDLLFPLPLNNPLEEKNIDVQKLYKELEKIFTKEGMAEIKETVGQAEQVMNKHQEDLNKISTIEYISKDPVIKRLYSVTKERMEEIRKFFTFVQDRIITRIKNGVSDDKLSPSQKASIVKIKTVQLANTPMNELMNHPECAWGNPNAFYDSLSHSITICPELLNYPDETIIGIFGHELTHPVDPCNSKFPTYKINQSILKAISFTEEESIIPEIEGDRGKKLMFQVLQQGAKEGYTSYPFELEDITPLDIKFYESLGIISKISDGISYKDYPLNDAYNCLTNKEKNIFEGFNPKKAEITAERVASYRSLKSNDVDYTTSKEKIFSLLNKYRDCDVTTRHAKINEAMADWMSANVVGDYLRINKIQLKTPGEKLAPVALHAMYACFDKFEINNTLKDEKDDGDRMNHIWGHYSIWANDPHPAMRARFDHIFALNEDIQRAWGKNTITHDPCKQTIGWWNPLELSWPSLLERNILCYQ